MRWVPDSTLDHLREVAAEPDLSGTPYEIVGTIGRGGMGTVYLARDRDLDREVALKVVQLHGEDTERMLREARILARLEHPGIVPIHDVGVLPDGRAWYVMKRVRGSRLDEHARTLTLPDRLRAFERICEAVAFAHSHGVIHRDLKPENIMVGPFGEVLVMDWGVAKIGGSLSPGTGERAGERGDGIKLPHPPAPSPGPPSTPAPGEGETCFELAGEGASAGGRWRPSTGAGVFGGPGEGSGVRAPTIHGTILGTPGYMAPEQERGEVERIDERTDVYALGAILSFLLQGEESMPPTPRPLEAIRSRAMAAEPEGRYVDVRELSADLGRYLDGLPVAAYRESLIEQASRVFRRYRVPILLVLAYLLMRALLILILGR